MALVVKNLPVIAGDERDMRLIPGSGRLPGGGHATPSIILAWRIGAKHWWVSGRILACHVGGPGLIPSQCKSTTICASQVGLVVKNPPAIAGGIKRQKFDPWVTKTLFHPHPSLVSSCNQPLLFLEKFISVRKGQ